MPLNLVRILCPTVKLGLRVANSAQASGTRERIRQIEAKAPQKLKHPSLACALRTFLEQ